MQRTVHSLEVSPFLLKVLKLFKLFNLNVFKKIVLKVAYRVKILFCSSYAENEVFLE